MRIFTNMIDPRLSKLKQLITGWDSDLFHGDFYFLLHYSAGYNSKLPPPPQIIMLNQLLKTSKEKLSRAII